MPMKGLRFAQLAALVLFGLMLLIAAPVHCQTGPNEREVKSLPSSLDKLDVWGMDVVFKDPRIMKIKLPARGERVVWYLWYQVINRSGKPREISPYFELVTLDN